MSDMTMTAGAPSREATGGVLYRMVWKWHFLASLYVLPFMLMLSLTGGIYLFKPQIESWLYHDAIYVSVGNKKLSYEDQIVAVEAAAGITRLRGITDYDDPGRSTLIEFNDADKKRSYAWVNPYTGEVLKIIERDAMAMQILRKFHGELLLGKFGTKFVELAAHWAIVMFATGIYLWWPRGTRTLSKAVSPPRGKGRSFWRETHMFTGFLATILIVPIIITGLPWTDVWGGSLSYIQKQTGTKSQSLRFSRDVPLSTQVDGQTIAYSQVFAIAQEQGLKAPYEMRPPKNNEAAFWIRSADKNRDNQSELIIDQYSGELLKTHHFGNNPGLAQAVSYGISFHQGELYGWLNVAQNSLAALLGVTLSVSGFVAWWMRRPAGSLGVPNAPERSLSNGMIMLIIALAILFPLMGATLLLALLLDWLIFSRIGLLRPKVTL